MDLSARGWAIAGLVGAMVSVGCGHRLVSALGNPGDYCTMPESCPEGSECQETEDGFRCVQGENVSQGSWARDEEEGDSSGENPDVEEDSDLDAEDDDDGEGESEPDDGEAEGEDDEDYEPPSRRRRRGR